MLDLKQCEFFEEFIAEIKNDLCKKVEAGAARFPSCEKLLSKFKDVSERLLAEGLEEVRSFIEFHNELCAAVSILEDPTCERLDYEPRVKGCEKRFDFNVISNSRKPIWVEVKTIHPIIKDDWNKYERDRHLGRFGGTELILDKEWFGGELYHKAIASRSKILEYVLQMEEKVESCLQGREGESSILLYFSNGFDWHVDRLEDFVFFYRYGEHLPEDTFGAMEEHHIKKEGIILQRNIDFFAYMERSATEVRTRRQNWNVRPTTPMGKFLT